MQKQMLWHSFQEKNKQLEMEHEKQLAHTIQVLLLLPTTATVLPFVHLPSRVPYISPTVGGPFTRRIPGTEGHSGATPSTTSGRPGGGPATIPTGTSPTATSAPAAVTAEGAQGGGRPQTKGDKL